MSPQAVKVVGFLVAGAALLGLAEIAPKAALGLTAVLGLGVLIGHASELQQLSNAFITATGHTAPGASSATPAHAAATATSAPPAVVSL